MDIYSNGYRKKMIPAQHWSKPRGWCAAGHNNAPPLFAIQSWMKPHFRTLSHWEVSWGGTRIQRKKVSCPCTVQTPSIHGGAGSLWPHLMLFEACTSSKSTFVHRPFLLLLVDLILHEMLVYLKTRSSNP